MANGLFAGGDGTELNPYLIEDTHDLNAVRNANGYYKLINDMDLNVTPYNEGSGWTPIPLTNVKINGDGFSIKNLYINSSTLSNIGFFGVGALNNSIKNTKFLNANVNGTKADCSAGVIVGDGQLSLENLVIQGMVNSTLRAGGVAGRTSSSSVTQKNVFVDVTVTSTSTTGQVGGYAGNLGGATLMKSCISIGAVGTTGQYRGGFAGYYTGGSNPSCFYDKETSGMTDTKLATPLTTLQAKTAQTFIDAGWNTEVLPDGTTQVWVLKDGEYPKLWFEYNPLSKILIKDSTGKIISRSTDNLSWVDTLETAITGTSFETYGMESNIVSSLTSADWNSLYNDINFTAPFEFQVFKEEDVIPVLTETTTENEFGVTARSYEVEISESDLQKVKSLSVV